MIEKERLGIYLSEELAEALRSVGDSGVLPSQMSTVEYIMSLGRTEPKGE